MGAKASTTDKPKSPTPPSTPKPKSTVSPNGKSQEAMQKSLDSWAIATVVLSTLLVAAIIAVIIWYFVSTSSVSSVNASGSFGSFPAGVVIPIAVVNESTIITDSKRSSSCSTSSTNSNYKKCSSTLGI